MACVGNDNPCFIGGDDLTYPVQFLLSDGETPIDLTGATAAMDLRDSVTDASVAQVMSGGITDATNGQMVFTLTDVETALLLPRTVATQKWVFSVKLTYVDLSEQTILAGELTLDQAATA
jgi:hypothetical protein